MQVVILCGGQGTRIRDVADDLPKPMIPIGGRPILWHIMKSYARHGFADFVLCLGYRSWDIKRFFLDYHLAGADFTCDLANPDGIEIHGSTKSENWRVTLAETGVDAMTGCRVKRIEKFITSEDFLLTYGDGVADVDIGQLLRFHQTHGKIGTLTAVRPPGRFGELELDDSHVLEFAEKPQLARGFISGGFFVFNRRIFDRLENDPRLVFENEPLAGLAADGELMAYKHDGFWHPMDNSRDFKYLNDLWNRGEAPWQTWSERHMRRPRLRVA